MDAGNVTFLKTSGIGPFTRTTTASATIDNGTLTLGVSGDQLNLSVGSSLGVQNNGHLNVNFDSDATAAGLFIGTSSGGTSSDVIVDGAGSSLNVTGISDLGLNGATGAVIFRNGSLSLSNLILGGSGPLLGGNSQTFSIIRRLNVTGNDPNEVITLTGYVKGVGTLDNVEFDPNAIYAPGFSPASVNAGSASYNGTLEIELAGATAGSVYDQLNHILGLGIANLGGTLDVSLLGGFVPTLGDTFDILTSIGGVSGTFASEMLPDLGGLLAMDVLHDGNSVSLAVVPALDGDFDVDGDVDGFDFLAWQRGETPEPLSQTDLTAWETNYGMVAPLSATSAAVPEPSALLLGAMAGLFAISFRRQS